MKGEIVSHYHISYLTLLEHVNSDEEFKVNCIKQCAAHFECSTSSLYYNTVNISNDTCMCETD